MSNICEVCGKQPGFGNNVSHSNKKTKRIFKPNIVKTRVIISGKVKNITICTKCLKADKAVKAV